MFLLRCLIGPPTGLNLRNILWHGFADYKEVPYQWVRVDCFEWLVICTDISVTVEFQDRPFYTYKIRMCVLDTMEQFTHQICEFILP